MRPVSPLPSLQSSRRLTFALMLAALLALFAGCTLQPTPYQPLGESGGYEQTRLGPQLYRVSFRGNRATPETTVLDFLYLRCAELTKQNGYAHFVVEKDFGRTQLTLRPGPRSSVGVGMGFGTGRSFWSLGFGAPLSDPDYEAVVSYHLGVFVIKMLTDEEAKPLQSDSQIQVYDAAFILKSLEAKKEASLHPGS